MEHAIEARRLTLAAVNSGPPHFAVLAVKCSVIGLLLLPVATLFWLVAYQSTPDRDLGPVAFLVALGLGAVMVGCIAFFTRAYPPVPPAHKR
ncbi:MAG TPA: hypothetical protein VLV17_01985 [Anaeromyxobacteraceae bacterium]|nr:hypothetical protein [Anaeromyxobacteraceae bacterium]